ncbi:MAG: cytochrome c oxidase subunit 4 [Chloroflexi bacterium]|nr:cytochrome c oxidase subunit 4 [Chloroflexota bacterium]
MIEQAWNGVLEILSLFVIPDWGALIALMPLGIFTLVVVVLLVQVRRLTSAPPARRGKRRMAPRTPEGIHMPGPSWAPIFAAIGTGLLMWGLVVGGPTIILGVIGLSIGLLYWLRESMRLYERDTEPSERQLPAIIPSGPPPGVHMPGPSYRPLLGALGVALLLTGLVFGGWLLAIGVLALIVSLLGWLNDARNEYVKTVEADTTGHLENIPAPRTPSRLLALFAVLIVGAVALQTGLLPPRSASGDTGGGPEASGRPPASGGPLGSGGPVGSGGSGGPPTGGGLQIAARDVAFSTATLTAAAGQPLTIEFDNQDAQPHNVAIHKDSPTGAEVYKGEIFTGPAKKTYAVPPLEAGTYGFVCTVHPTMTGTLTVE